MLLSYIKHKILSSVFNLLNNCVSMAVPCEQAGQVHILLAKLVS